MDEAEEEEERGLSQEMLATAGQCARVRQACVASVHQTARARIGTMRSPERRHVVRRTAARDQWRAPHSLPGSPVVQYDVWPLELELERERESE